MTCLEFLKLIGAKYDNKASEGLRITLCKNISGFSFKNKEKISCIASLYTL